MNDEYYPEDINDFCMYYAYQDSNGEYVIPLYRVREALEHYYYEDYSWIQNEEGT